MNLPPISDAEALDLMIQWFEEEMDGDQWGSAADFIEYAATLLERTGRDLP